MSELANVYADILKYDKNEDGTLTVYGKATDDSVDIDQQICDPSWLDKAMPEWFMTGGNIREQHSNIAAGVAKEYEQKADGHYISALVVDPVSVKKVENRVLRGFSIGIKSPRVVRDQKAANGRIIDGQIVEVSLVDRPANPNCQLVLAKSINGEKTLTRVEELVETDIVKDTMEEGMPMGGETKVIPSREEMTSRYASARKAMDDIMMECKSYGYDDIAKQYGETAEQETEEGSYPNAAEEEVSEARGEKPLDKELVDGDGNEMDKSATHKCLECGCNMPANNHGNPNLSTAVMVTPDQTPVPTPAIQPPTPKSVETIVPPSTIEEIGTVIEDEDSDEDDSLDKSLLADVNITDIVEKAVKSAISGISAEVALLKSAKEAVENKAAQLETELATAKSLAIGGGPKRTTIATGSNKPNEWKSKADLYFAKASATTDKDLAKGYREMAKDYLAKAEVEA